MVPVDYTPGMAKVNVAITVVARHNKLRLNTKQVQSLLNFLLG